MKKKLNFKIELFFHLITYQHTLRSIKTSDKSNKINPIT